MELPYVFRTSPNELPLAERYLDRSGLLKLRYRNVVRSGSDRLRIGLASQGGSWDCERWLSFAAVQTLIEGSGLKSRSCRVFLLMRRQPLRRQPMFYMVILRNSRERSPIMISSSQSTHCPLTWRSAWRPLLCPPEKRFRLALAADPLTDIVVSKYEAFPSGGSRRLVNDRRCDT